jgi:hypothetical protein
MKIKLKKYTPNVVVKIKSLLTLEKVNSHRTLERVFTKSVGGSVHEDNVKNDEH